MNYIEYKESLKKLNISSLEFMKMLNMNEKTPATNWRKKNEIPRVIELFLETLWRLPEDDRILFIYHKLKI